ncbi:endolytic transglycosylase MltG [Pseudothauera rhizosphaerae]|uniref:Endolytic murein transglycosylase n=1 Tax=Pseudothauera rhizosphaerae TaxID=2565932 RepID=A0A4S4ABY3_9RHOO|nr:endolytic transglycosylase MltG [Pseudothauera rhizosphaerae]THF56517.1 endolytic transglycosylase MltG [Pseudothauera rhizosphaerae]
MRFLFRLVLIIAVLAGLAAAAAWWVGTRPLALSAPVIDFTVQRGHNMRQAANTIAAAGVAVEPRVLYWVARLSGKARLLKAGSYEVHEGLTLWQLVLKLSSGDVSQADLTLVEGWNFHQVRAAIESHPYLTQDAAGLTDAELLQRVGAAEAHPEGLFFPDTYVFDKHSGALALYRRAYQSMQERLRRAWDERQPGLPLASPYEALILASIVEKETGRPEDRGLVASVFINRLRIGMRLQTDPAVIYGYGPQFEGRLRRHHLDTDHPWNTYTRAGLPPTPIAMPGMESLRATLQPTASQYFYFVSRGDGSSEFSRNLADHNRAVNRFQRGGNGS